MSDEQVLCLSYSILGDTGIRLAPIQGTCLEWASVLLQLM